VNGALHKSMAPAAALVLDEPVLTTSATAPSPVPSTAHRAAPLKAIDEYRILSAHEITAEKLVRADDPYLEGHYPDFTIYPGVFVIESVTQTVHALVEQTWESRIEIELTAIKSVRFTSPVLVGDTLRIRCLCTYVEDNRLTVKADCHIDRNELDPDLDDAGAGAASDRAARMTLEFRLVRADAHE